MRDDKWLFARLDMIWDEHFSDVPQHNNVKIVWGRKAKNRFGSIKQERNNKIFILNSKNLNKIKNSSQNSRNHPDSIITINSLFKDEKIPDYVIDATIGHELCHYTHGFNSPLEKMFENPHQGGVVDKEMCKRGMENILKKQKKWVKENWRDYVIEKMPNAIKPRKAKRKIIIKWI